MPDNEKGSSGGRPGELGFGSRELLAQAQAGDTRVATAPSPQLSSIDLPTTPPRTARGRAGSESALVVATDLHSWSQYSPSWRRPSTASSAPDDGLRPSRLRASFLGLGSNYTWSEASELLTSPRRTRRPSLLMFSSGGMQSQSQPQAQAGPDLEEIETEVCIRPGH